MEKLKQAVEWFGDKNRWTLINKCFFPERSLQFLKNSYYNTGNKVSNKKQKEGEGNKNEG